MAWEARNGQRYFYEVFRNEDGKVQRRYLGRGAKAEAAAKALEQVKCQTATDRLALLQLETAATEVRSETAVLDKAVCDLVNAHLLLTGHYLHCGTWRKRRDTNS